MLCPISHALRRMGFTDVVVGRLDADFAWDERLAFHDVKLPPQAMDFTRDVDHGRKVEPITFELELP